LAVLRVYLDEMIVQVQFFLSNDQHKNSTTFERSIVIGRGQCTDLVIFHETTHIFSYLIEHFIWR